MNKYPNYLRQPLRNPNSLDDVIVLVYSDLFQMRYIQSYIQFKKIAI